MEKLMIENILAEIKKYNKIAIYRHIHPDGDAYGSQVGLREVLRESFPEKHIVALGHNEKRLSYIGEMDDGENMEIEQDTLAIILDVANAERVDNQSFNDCGMVIKIDHHYPFDAPFETISWVDTAYPATCVMIIDLVLASEGVLKFTRKAREALYVGVTTDTGRFEYVDNPTSLFEKLPHITYDLETKKLYEACYMQTLNEIQFKGYIYSHFKVCRNGVAILKIPYEIVNKYEMTSIAAARTVNALKGIEGITNWHFFAEKEDGTIFGEFRSCGPCVNEIASKYGGGGHFFAAGATLSHWEMVEAIIKDFEENTK